MHLPGPIPCLLLVAGLACFLGFSWGMKRHFRSVGPMPPGMMAVSLLTLAGFIWYLGRLVAMGASGLWEVAVICFLLAFSLFVWAVRSSRHSPPTVAFSEDEPFFLLRHGPYRYVRHPFYTSYILFWIATAMATPGITGWAAPVVMLLVYWDAARREERKFARSTLSAAYAEYKAKAGMFLPHFGSSLPS